MANEYLDYLARMLANAPGTPGYGAMGTTNVANADQAAAAATPAPIPPTPPPVLDRGDVGTALHEQSIYADLRTKAALDRWLKHQVYADEQPRDPAMDYQGMGQGRYNNSITQNRPKYPNRIGQYFMPRYDLRDLAKLLRPGAIYFNDDPWTSGLGYTSPSMLNRNTVGNRLESFLRGDGNAIAAEAYRMANPQTQLGRVESTPSAAQRNLGAVPPPPPVAQYLDYLGRNLPADVLRGGSPTRE